jgi:hypothetical protein
VRNPLLGKYQFNADCKSTKVVSLSDKGNIAHSAIATKRKERPHKTKETLLSFSFRIARVPAKLDILEGDFNASCMGQSGRREVYEDTLSEK